MTQKVSESQRWLIVLSKINTNSFDELIRGEEKVKLKKAVDCSTSFYANCFFKRCETFLIISEKLVHLMLWLNIKFYDMEKHQLEDWKTKRELHDWDIKKVCAKNLTNGKKNSKAEGATRTCDYYPAAEIKLKVPQTTESFLWYSTLFVLGFSEFMNLQICSELSQLLPRARASDAFFCSQHIPSCSMFRENNFKNIYSPLWFCGFRSFSS